jgi:hypothetical protein
MILSLLYPNFLFVVSLEEERYNSATQVFALYGRFFRIVAKEIGIEKALELHKESGEEGGKRIGEWLKERKWIDSLSAKVFLPILKEINQPFGYDSTYSIEGNSILLNTHRCPWYQGFKYSGQSHENSGELCGHFLRAFFNGLKEFYPNVVYNLDFRQDEEGHCVETITFT